MMLYKDQYQECKGQINQENVGKLKFRYEYIANWIKCNNYTKIAEIGTSTGYTSDYLLHHCNLKYYLLVDPDPHGKFPYEYLCKIYPWVAYFVRLKSKDAVRLVDDESLDLVYIDADHSYESTLEDIKMWKPKVRKGGILCGHDYDKERQPWIIDAVHKVFKEVNTELEILNYGASTPTNHVWWKYI